MKNLMRIHYIAGINSNGIQITIENQNTKIFSQINNIGNDFTILQF